MSAILNSKHVRLIRHAESAANAGLVTTDPDTIPLTEKGHQQAAALAASLDSAPELIVYSPFDRARLTAQPIIQRFPDVPTATWPVEEFTYLSPRRFNGSTQAQRKPQADGYWAQGDAAFRDGEDAESFRQLLDRAQVLLDRLARHEAEDILVVSHGQFIRAVAWLVLYGDEAATPARMRAFRQQDVAVPFGNCQSYLMAFGPDGWRVLYPISADGLPQPADPFCSAP
ncbi:histidine phosphatase family protein [Pseudomonas huaxiensis]|uniref:histidine phosphatase family protein n=1 Tax=Pseudomonas huaxiensis TaxID=2213017 RepID=UPI000DA6D489|nr:histidine phosphatase family protein [Pseudomonas huaxiensis]